MTSDQIAINAITTANATLEKLCAAYAAAGFKNVEFPLGRVKEFLHRGHSARGAKKLLSDHGLRCIGGFETHVACFGGHDDLRKNHELVIANAKLISELGGNILVVGTDGPPDNSAERSFIALDAIGRTLVSLIEKFPAEVSLAIEFNWSPIVKSLKSAKAVVDAANHPRVGILFDPAHFYCTPSKFDDLTTGTVKKILHVHVDDMREKPGDFSHCNDDRVLPGEGCLDLGALFARIEKLGYRGYFSLELFNADIWKLPVEEAARRSYRAMTTLVNAE